MPCWPEPSPAGTYPDARAPISEATGTGDVAVNMNVNSIWT
jgi:hypothetical protein